ncbi:hypothetical protein QQP08_007320 [Theobroma cacao]|nr:hypothetical protein QQP08_007320 [Theobroma cacao]
MGAKYITLDMFLNFHSWERNVILARQRVENQWPPSLTEVWMAAMWNKVRDRKRAHFFYGVQIIGLVTDSQTDKKFRKGLNPKKNNT